MVRRSHAVDISLHTIPLRFASREEVPDVLLAEVRLVLQCHDGDRTHNILHVAMPLELLPCKEPRLISRLGVMDSASAPDDGPVER